MRFISCIPVISEDDDTGVVLCQAEFSDDRCCDLKHLQDISIKELLASEGSEIAAIKDVSFEQLRCFSHTDALKSWYELVIVLSAGFFRLDIDRSWAEKAQWGFHYVNCTWKLAFETRIPGLTKRFCELELAPAREKEVDLFEMSMKLYQDYVAANQRIHQLEQKCKELQNSVNDSQRKQKEDEEMIKKRDERTRTLVIGLLNEKKAMIRRLQTRLEENRAPEDIPDEYLINRFVSQPVSRMTSPRKRASLCKSGTPSPKKKALKTLVKQEEEQDQWDDFGEDNVELMGINRERTVSTPNLRLELSSSVKNPFSDETWDLKAVKDKCFTPKRQSASPAGSIPGATVMVEQQEEPSILDVTKTPRNKEGKAKQSMDKETDQVMEQESEEETEGETEEETEGETEAETDA